MYNEEFNSLHRSPNTARTNKSRRIRLGGHESRMEENSPFKFLKDKSTG